MQKQRSFQRLQIELSDLIGRTPPGERLPSEPALAKQMSVSRATLREAMRAFESQGFISRRQGIGTFVVNRSRIIESGLEVLESIETVAKRIQLDVSMGDLNIQRIQADEELASIFVTKKDQALVQIRRTIIAEKRPVAFLQDILPEEILTPADLSEGFTGSVLDLLLQRGTPQLVNSLTEIRSVAAPSDVARALRIQRGDVLLMFVARLYSKTNEVVDYSSSYFLPGYFRFHVVRSINGIHTSVISTENE
jgi:GntR family transcriptional regulator